jgi:aconitate hydratase
MTITGIDTLQTKRALTVDGAIYQYYSLAEAAKLGDISRLPFSLKILLENLLRFQDERTVSVEDIKALCAWTETQSSTREIAYRPARVLMQDFTGVPAVADLAAMRDAVVKLGGKASRINPLCAVDLVIDHSVMVDEAGTPTAFQVNVEREFERNFERYAFLRWGQNAFANFRVVPPGTGICHQVNLEYLAQTVWVEADQHGEQIAYPDTLVGTDSHTTMVNGLAVLGWGVGGIEAEAAMLGQPVSMLIPEVVGFRLTGQLPEGTTATDLVLTVTQLLRKQGVVNKFVEFYGPGLESLGLADRATIANMAPEYGATCGFFPIDKETIRYLNFTGRDPHRVKLVEAYARAQGMWRDETTPEPLFSATLELDLSTVEPSLAGPRRPQDKVLLSQAASAFAGELKSFGVTDAAIQIPLTPSSRGLSTGSMPAPGMDPANKSRDDGIEDITLTHGSIVLAAITSCTNTSNPSVLIAAGLVAKKAVERGLAKKPWVKTSLAPGSQVVTDYLAAAGLQPYLDQLGFNLVGYGCTTCIGNSGPLPEPVSEAIEAGNLVAAAVLSGNRNFEGRIQPFIKANYLASPPLVVAYALAGSMTIDLVTEPLGMGSDGQPVYLRDIWPTGTEIRAAIEQYLSPEMFRRRYANVFQGPEPWRAIATAAGETYAWDATSTYVKQPPFFSDMGDAPPPIHDVHDAYALAILGDSVTTDHISPAGDIKKAGPAGEYLIEHQVRPLDFNSYGARRGNHEIMMRGTFANIRIRNEMAPGTEGGVTRYVPTGDIMPIYTAAMAYAVEGTPLVIFAGREYGTGSSRDWAAKGTRLLGVKAVIAESFERIHRSNLVGMGVLPLQFRAGVDRKTLALDGSERFDITGLEAGITPHMEIVLTIHRADGASENVPLLCRIDTLDEVEYYKNGGILQYVLRRMKKTR